MTHKVDKSQISTSISISTHKLEKRSTLVLSIIQRFLVSVCDSYTPLKPFMPGQAPIKCIPEVPSHQHANKRSTKCYYKTISYRYESHRYSHTAIPSASCPYNTWMVFFKKFAQHIKESSFTESAVCVHHASRCPYLNIPIAVHTSSTKHWRYLATSGRIAPPHATSERTHRQYIKFFTTATIKNKNTS